MIIPTLYNVIIKVIASNTPSMVWYKSGMSVSVDASENLKVPEK